MATTAERRWLPVGVAVGLSLLAVWVEFTSGHDQAFGPLTWEGGKALALGIWLAAPILGGLAARTHSNRSLRRAGLSLGIIMAVATLLFPTSGAGPYTCSLDLPLLGPASYVVGRLVVAALLGGGMAAAILVTGYGARRLLTALPAIGVAGALHYAAGAAAYAVYYDGVRCL